MNAGATSSSCCDLGACAAAAESEKSRLAAMRPYREARAPHMDSRRRRRLRCGDCGSHDLYIKLCRYLPSCPVPPLSPFVQLPEALSARLAGASDRSRCRPSHASEPLTLYVRGAAASLPDVVVVAAGPSCAPSFGRAVLAFGFLPFRSLFLIPPRCEHWWLLGERVAPARRRDEK